jgi:hypothetical protein
MHGLLSLGSVLGGAWVELTCSQAVLQAAGIGGGCQGVAMSSGRDTGLSP